jgi:hypothetical protein
MTVNHTHEPADDDPTTRQGWIDHMVQTHGISPTHFRDLDESAVISVHTREHQFRQRTATDRVNHPEHYNSHPSGVECIDIIEWMTLNCGNAVKYLWRAGLKDEAPEIEDLKKARWYIDREIKRLERTDGQPGGHAERKRPQDSERRRPVRDSPQA